MNYCIEAINKYIPPQNIGYQFIKRAMVYIPYQEVGLSILERKEAQFSFVYETILKLLAQGINNIDQMALLLGLDDDIYKEIIAQMAVEDLVNVSEMSLTLSPKGKQALQDFKKIVIVKSQINRVFTNLITGEIEAEENNNFFDRPKPNCMCLDQDQNLNMDIQFFRDHFTEIENIYNKEKADENDFNTHPEVIQSLYRILDIVYQETKYLVTNCFVYINEEDSSLLFSFENDKNSVYAATAMSQVSNNITSAMNLFRGYELPNYTKLDYSEEKERALKELISLLEQRSKTTIPTEEIESKYFQDRYMLDGEIRDILVNCKDYKPHKIIICSFNIKDFLQDNNLMDTLLSLNTVTNITFIYNSKEHNISKSINWILEKASEKDKKRLAFRTFPDDILINYSIILCQPGFVINIVYEEIKFNEQRCLLKEKADISFDTIKIDETLKKLSSIIKDII
jgi:predicted transcriptional regulator